MCRVCHVLVKCWYPSVGVLHNVVVLFSVLNSWCHCAAFVCECVLRQVLLDSWNICLLE